MNFDFLTPEEALAAQLALKDMTKEEKIAYLHLLEKKEERGKLKLAQTNMLEFAKRVYPGFKIGPHHKKLAKIFQDVVEGRKKRVIINIAPRMGKSEFSSYLFPAYFLGNFPHKKIIRIVTIIFQLVSHLICIITLNYKLSPVSLLKDSSPLIACEWIYFLR